MKKSNYIKEVHSFVQKDKELRGKGYTPVTFPEFETLGAHDDVGFFSAYKGTGSMSGNFLSKAGSLMEPVNTPIKMKEGLGAMPWGADNNLPLNVFRSAKTLPYTASALRYLTDLMCGKGIKFMYRYVKNAGGEFKERFVNVQDAGIVLRDRIRRLRAELKSEQEEKTTNEPVMSSPLFPMTNEWSGEEDDEIGTTKDELKRAIEDYNSWEKCSAEVVDFMRRNDLNEHFHKYATDNVATDLAFATVGLSKGERDNWNAKIVSIGNIDVVTGRYEKKDEYQNINNIYYSEAWRHEDNNLNTVKAVMYPLLGNKTTRFARRDMVGQLDGYVASMQNVRPSKRRLWWAVPVEYSSTENAYYPQPHWWCLYYSLVMMYMSTFIFDRVAARQNSTMWGKIIYINQDYLERLFAQEGIQNDKQKMKERRKSLIAVINNFLKDRSNNGKTVTLDAYASQEMKQIVKAIEIVDVPAPKPSTASIEEFNYMISIVAWAMGIHSSLLADKPGASNGGTFQRELHLLKQNQMSPRQQAYMKFLENIAFFNRWPANIVPVIEMPILTTLDNSKTGIVEEQQTT